MPATYRVRVLDRNIVTLIQVGEVARWTHATVKRIESLARVLAPKRTGRLAASHVTLPTTGSNQYHKVYRVSALAPYGVYVHQGTGIYGDMHRPIISTRGMKLPGPGTHNGPGKSTVIFVSKGQRAQPWLERAADAIGSSI